jgi:hypothetical protein
MRSSENLAARSRSSRAISDSCNVAGIARPVRFVPSSSTARVNSSTNSGTPPVRSITASTVSPASGLLGDHRAPRIQAVERDLRMMRPQRPLRAKLGACRREQQQTDLAPLALRAVGSTPVSTDPPNADPQLRSPLVAAKNMQQMTEGEVL